jgi:hypothetical protein
MMKHRSVRYGALATAMGMIAVVARAAAPLSLDDVPPPNPIAPQPPSAAPADKSGYTLFNPTPGKMLRGLNSDRPDVTEGPYTVDAGHYQLEFSFVEYTHDDDHGDRTDGFSVLPANLRIGLLNNLEADVIVNPYENILFHGHGESARNAGFGDSELRAKLNLWGNDSGQTAFGLLPFIKLPTGTDDLSNHHVEGGLILPVAIADLPGKFDLGAMAEFDIDHNDRDGGYGVNVVHTITLGHALFSEKINAYIEYVGVCPISVGQSYLAYFDTGVTYVVNENLQLDCGINIGLSQRADDFTLFTGLSFRI